MSRRSERIEARRKALGWKVISNDTPVVPPSRPPSVQDQLIGSGFTRRRRPEPKPEPKQSDAVFTPPSAPVNTVTTTADRIIARPGVPSESDFPPQSNGGKLTLASVDGNSDDIRVKASNFAAWLEQEYRDKLAPFSFLHENVLNVDDLPAEAVINMAFDMMRKQGWQVAVSYFNSAGCNAGVISMISPENAGF